MASMFLARAKTGTLGLKSYKHPISTQSGMDGIREAHKNYVEGNIRQYAMLGSQNAIQKSGTTISSSTQTETEFKPPSSTETTFHPVTRRILGGAGGVRKVFEINEQGDVVEKKTLGEGGAGQRKVFEAKIGDTPEEPESTGGGGAPAPKPTPVKPSENPPFDVISSDGKKAFQEYAQYLADKYTQPIAQVKIDEIYEDSTAFSLAIRSINKLEQAIDRFESDKASGFAQWLNNAVSDLLGKVLGKIIDTIKDALKGVLTYGTGGAGFVVGELAGAGIDEVRNILQGLTSFKQDYIGSIRKAIEDLFSIGGIKWKSKYAKIKAEWDRKNKEIEEKMKKMKDEADAWFSSQEYREFQKWKKEHPNATLNEESNKFYELQNRWRERVRNIRESVENIGGLLSSSKKKKKVVRIKV